MNLWFRGILQTFIFFKYIFSFCSNKEKGSKTTLIANLAPKFDQKHVPVISIPVLYFIGSWINYTKIVHGMLMTTFKWVSSTPFGFPFRLPVLYILGAVWKSGGGALSTVVGIICPPGWDKVSCLAKTWKWEEKYGDETTPRNKVS